MTAQVLSFHCELKNKSGQVLSTSLQRGVLNAFPADGSPLSGLAEGLQELKTGERRSISLSAEAAYGCHDPKKVILFPLKKIPNSLSVSCGQKVTLISKTNSTHVYKVLQFHGDMVLLDGNHPLAGQELTFEIEAIDARDATSHEIFEARNPLSSQVLH